MADLDTARRLAAELTEALEPPGAVALAADVARVAEMAGNVPPVWARITQATGGFWVTVSPDAIETNVGFVVPEQHPPRHYARATFDELCAVLASRFGCQ